MAWRRASVWSAFNSLSARWKVRSKRGVVAGETIGQGIEQVDSGFEDMDTAQIPGGCDEFVEESLLQSALRGDFELVVGMQCSEGFAFFGFDDQLLGG